MTVHAPIASVDRIEVRDDYNQTRRRRLHDIFPKSKVHAKKTGKKIGTYRLPKLGNALVSGDGVSYFEGEPGPQPRPPGEGTVTISDPTGKSTNREDHYVDAPETERFQRYASKIPRHYDQCHRFIDISLVSYLTSSTYFTTESFTGPDLDDYLATAHPDVDINQKLRVTSDSVRLRDLQGLMSPGGNLELWCVMDAEVARVLSRHPCYAGSSFIGTGVGDGTSGTQFGNTTGQPSYMPMGLFGSVFKNVHGFDKVEIVESSLYNSARAGQTEVIASITNGLLWMGIVDTGSYDLTTTGEGPDGAIAILMPEPMGPQDNLWHPQDGSKLECYAAHVEYTLVTPRYSSDAVKYGIYWDSTTIFS